MKNRMNILSATLLIAIVLISVALFAKEDKVTELDACHMYEAYENTKTVFGGYVPDWCMSDKEFVDSINQKMSKYLFDNKQ